MEGLAGYTRNRSDFAALARSGTAIMSPLPQSGTTPRANANAIMGTAGAALGATLAGPPGAIGGALAGLAATTVGPGMAGRVLMSSPVQRYLGNQAATNAMAALGDSSISIPGAIMAETRPGNYNAMLGY